MKWERFRRHGKDVSFRGIPFNESFSQKEGKALRFERWRLLHFPEDHTPTDITVPRDSITVVNPGNVASISEFFGRHRRRGPYGNKG